MPGNFVNLLRALLLAACLALSGAAWAALDASAVSALASDDSDERVAAISALAASGEPRARQILKALSEDGLYTTKDKTGAIRVVLEESGTWVDAASGAPIDSSGERDAINTNNRLRGALDAALAAFDLSSPDVATRLAAAEALQGADDPALLPAIEAALARESDTRVRERLANARAALGLRAPEAAQRLAAVRALSDSDSPQVRQMLSERLDPANESDAAVRAAAQATLAEIAQRLRKYELLNSFFSGLSLGSILLLAAIGLAITFGLMGVINMAHGEFLMIGAYCTYVVQSLFRAHAPGLLEWYPVAALPVAFLVTALLGVLLERSVIRWFHGRPLDTLLATWGVSLLLIQGARSLFGAQNVELANPSWMAGGIELAGGQVLAYNRIAIIVFAAVVVALVWWLLARTRMGLFVRAVTQNRAMASAAGVPTDRVDMLTFGLGSGLAGLAGVALSQIGNVGPELGTGFIIDSFMVVVLGGVGQIAGTVISALGLGALAKLIEPAAGPVLAKIALLLLVILVIQKRPQGLFAVKGRSADA
ncbi:MAG TPA: urea ABC transporter permease subunit UrtB [Burkholderiaceae bacterium]|nr:urea ABC transporter permease subunit UrtB [Burkholderiaceae bacterium]